MQPVAINLYTNPVTGYLPGFAMNLEPPDWEGYTDDIDQMGGFLQCSFNLIQPRDVLEQVFEYGLDRAVDVWARSGLPIWEGTVDEMTLTIGRVALRKRLSQMGNRIWFRGSWGGVSGQRSTILNHAVSQARYGVKERIFSCGQAVGLGQADQAANIALRQIGLPKVSASIRGSQAQNSGASLEIRCKGWWNKFYWRVYNQTVLTGTAAAYAIIGRILDSLESTAVVNYCLNPSFEVNVTDDWAFYQAGAGGSANLDATQYYVGAKSCRFRAGTGVVGAETPNLSVPNGATVVAQARVRCSADPTGNKALIYLYDYTNSAYRGLAYATVASNGAWEYLTVSWTNNTGLAANIVMGRRNSFNDSAADVWFDACQLELGPATPYCDGTLPNCGWSSVPHNSTSWRKTLGFVKNRAIQRNDSATQEKYDSDQWPADIMAGLGKAGDQNYRLWIAGMRAGREFYFEPSAASVVPA